MRSFTVFITLCLTCAISCSRFPPRPAYLDVALRPSPENLALGTEEVPTIAPSTSTFDSTGLITVNASQHVVVRYRTAADDTFTVHLLDRFNHTVFSDKQVAQANKDMRYTILPNKQIHAPLHGLYTVHLISARQFGSVPLDISEPTR